MILCFRHPVPLIITVLALLWLSLIVESCASAIPNPQETDLAMLPPDMPGITLKDLRAGRSLYAENCGACHRLKVPEEHTDPFWRASFARMRTRVRLTPVEEEWIIAYLCTFAQRTALPDSSK